MESSAMTEIRPLHLLCDMDGTIVDTEGLKDEAWRRAVGEVTGRDPDPVEHWKVYSALVGSPGIQVAGRIIRHYGLSVTDERLWQLREKHRRMLYADRTALRERACTPVIDFIRRLREGVAVLGGGSVVLVTTAGKDQVDAVMAVLEIGDLFDRMIYGLEKSAENPACYRAALSSLACQPEDCLALEDSTAGYEAARAAGIPCLLLPNAYTRSQRL